MSNLPPCHCLVRLTDAPIEPAALLDAIRSPRAGAVVLFLGTTRETTGSRVTASLDYEAYPAMAQAKLDELALAARQRWPLVALAIVHRLGHLEPGEISVAVAASAPHRDDAFQAGRWLIDTLKESVPIWKRETWADGRQEWVHPGIDPALGRLSAPPRCGD